MSDSDDDWFEKDIDEFVVQAPTSNVEHISVAKVPDADTPTPLNIIYADADYGGCYTTKANNANRTSNNHQAGNANAGSGGGGVGVGGLNSTNAMYIQPISFKKLSYLLDQTSLNIFLDIIQTDSGFFETLNRSSNSTEMILLTIKVILKFVETPFIKHIQVFLSDVRKKCSYWKQIENILKETIVKQQPTATAKQKKKNNKVILHRNDLELWQQIYALSAAISKHIELPNGFVKNVLAIIAENKNDNLNLAQFKINFGQLLNERNGTMVTDATATANETEQTADQQQPYQIYRQTDIYPSLDELKQKQKLPDYVKPNIVKGRFQNVAQYLDIHLALLREDFIHPLRDGISQIIEQATTSPDTQPKSNFNVRFYPNVRILIRQRDSFGKSNFKSEYLMVDLEASTRADANLLDSNNNTNKYSKKLMYGSLLCFSQTPKFDDLIIAIVSNRDVDLLNQGYIQIEIIYSYNIGSVFDRDLIMCESDVYFETYRHVYSVLKSFTDETFPMKNYIIDVDPSPHYPNYIPAKGKIVFTYKQHTLDLKNTSTWPPASAMKFNDSQLEALKHAITRQFSVIQGPPGCGKTHMGLAIIATLLMNTDSQILIVSYTNHALDQFLTGILRYTDSIVRIGNQSKNEHLDCFNIKQLCENGITDKRVKTSLFKLKVAYADAVQEFHNLQNTPADETTFEKYSRIQEKLQSISRMQEEMKQIGEYQLIKSKRIIGMTSTGAARCNALIQLLQTPIVVFEEAAEILESHIVAALTRSVQHLILIGDHQQLRPTTSVYELARKFHMDVSLFERMINNNMHSVTLTTQYRMRPEIANLIRPNIYKDLLDDDSVKFYPDVIGMAKNLYFIDHNEPESGETDETTKKNVYESQYIVALCNYLIVQGYKAEEISILTTYNGQIFQFAQDRKKYTNLRKVRITAVDNFQGEDNKIILLSLVRSNTANNIGYLAFKNRICVALSRAKHGLYIIGNMSCLSAASPIWKNVHTELQNQQAIGHELDLVCSTHRTIHKIIEPTNFDDIKYGGCQNLCDIQLHCGHHCTLVCHTNAFEHFSECQCAF